MGVALPLASAESFDSTKEARILVVVQMVIGWEWGREGGGKGGGDGGGGGDRKINRRCKGEYCRAFTNAQRMPVSIRPSVAESDEGRGGPGLRGARLQFETQRPAAK